LNIFFEIIFVLIFLSVCIYVFIISLCEKRRKKIKEVEEEKEDDEEENTRQMRNQPKISINTWYIIVIDFRIYHYSIFILYIIFIFK